MCVVFCLRRLGKCVKVQRCFTEFGVEFCANRGVCGHHRAKDEQFCTFLNVVALMLNVKVSLVIHKAMAS